MKNEIDRLKEAISKQKEESQAYIESKAKEIDSLKSYTVVLQNTILRLEERFEENKANLIELVNKDILKNLEINLRNQPSVIIDKSSNIYKTGKKRKKDDSGDYRINLLEDMTDTKSLVQNGNVLESHKKLDFSKLTPYYNSSVIEASVKNASVLFMEEIKKLNLKYDKVMCSIENLNEESPMVNIKKEMDKNRNSLQNEQFKEFFKTLANRVKDRYEDNLDSKVFNESS